MSFKYRSAYSTKQTPQSQPIPGSTQVQNSAGGFAWQITPWQLLDRFLILGCESSTYYAKASALKRENAEAVLLCLKEDGVRAVKRIVEISDAGRAPKNSPAIFALALAMSFGDETAKHEAFAALPRVCRIGTHLYELAEYLSGMRGWGRGLKTAVGNWFVQKDENALAYQLLKYQQRNGWASRDLLRLSHPKPRNEIQKALFHWATKGWESVGEEPHPEESLRQIWAMERLKSIADPTTAASLIADYHLPREAVSSEMLKHAIVWEALLPTMPATALLRNLGTLSKVGLLGDREAEQLVLSKIGDAEWLHRSRIHPIAVLMALRTYGQGHGVRSQASWSVNERVVEALDRAFYTCFANVEPTGKRILIALDVSGSMGGGEVGGIPGLTPRDASAALALVTLGVEPNCSVVGFTSDRRYSWSSFRSMGGNTSEGITPLPLHAGQKLPEAIKVVSDLDFGGTDCALPMLWASKVGCGIDVFQIYTDSETYDNPRCHPVQALKAYREKTGIASKLAVIAMVSNGFSIADPNDSGMLDAVGFDSSLPEVLGVFSRGDL